MPQASGKSATKEKVDLHLRDINDTISEEDISNIDVTSMPKYRMVNKEEKRETNKVAPAVSKEDSDKKIPVSWNIL